MSLGISAYRAMEGCQPREKAFLRALRGHNDDKVTWSIYADWLDEAGRPIEAAEARQKAGLCVVTYQIVHAATGYSVMREYGTLPDCLHQLSYLGLNLHYYDPTTRSGVPTSAKECALRVVVRTRSVAATVPVSQLDLDHHYGGLHE
jgi:uncharacterized protein (TIGR02996 family)